MAGGKGGRPRKPDHLKVVSGTAQKCRMNPNAPTPSKAAPEPPALLSDRAQEIFRDITAICYGMGMSSTDHTAMQMVLAMRLEEVEILYDLINDPSIGRVYVTTNMMGDKSFKSRPEVAQMNAAMRHAQSLLAEFGLSPAAVGKVSRAPERPENAFAAFG